MSASRNIVPKNPLTIKARVRDDEELMTESRINGIVFGGRGDEDYWGNGEKGEVVGYLFTGWGGVGLHVIVTPYACTTSLSDFLVHRTIDKIHRAF